MHQGRPPIHGLYSKYSKVLLADKIAEAERDPKILEMTGEIALVRSLMADLLEKIDDTGRLDGETRDVLADLALKVGTLVEKHKKVTEGTTHTIRVENVKMFLAQVGVVISEIKDLPTRAHVTKRLGEIRCLPD